jgi:uncharacterized protein
VSEHAAEWFTAIQKGDEARVVQLLAEAPELLEARDAYGISSVMWACYARQGAVLARLLAADPGLDVFEAVAAGHEGAAGAWLERDPALAHAWSPDGFTALHLAAFFSHAGLAARLLALGADARAAARKPSRVTPLHSAVAAGAGDIARLLLEHGADPDARQAQGFTALMSAAQQDREELASLLLAHGADREARCDDGRAAADFADQKGHHALAARLRTGAAR